MRKVLLVLLAFLGWAWLRSRPSTVAGDADPFPFPTAAAHDAIDLRDPDAVDAACRKLGCSRHELFDVAAVVGTSLSAVRDRLGREDRATATQ